MFGFRDIGIDLGTATILVYVRGKGIVLKEPSVISKDKNTNTILAVGEEARRMLGRTPGNIVAIRPLSDGVISDYESTLTMLKYFIRKAAGRRLFGRPRVVICVPSGVTEVEKRAVLEAAAEAGAGKTYIIEEAIAAAIGAGLDISKACGNMVVDIGGGTTDIAVISLGGAVLTESIKIAGNDFDESVIRYMRKKHNILIGERTAEELKIKVGCGFPRTEVTSMDVTGRNMVSGLPKTITVTSEDMLDALSEPVSAIIEAVCSALERTPPELSSDICEQGILLTGGGSLLYGVDKALFDRTQIPIYLAEDAISAVALGTGRALESLDIYNHTAVFEQRKQTVSR
ncbi:MAG TPA: rod shape-determining protein MreB [Bacillota bacterium]|nr:rod shape-determining protein MreB [Bacillota bacterium]